MRCGISTACFYPENTLDALQHVADAGAKVTEIFLNTFSELEPDYIQRLKEVCAKAGLAVSAIHPFTSSLESFLFATDYQGRLDDGKSLYRQYFEACRQLGANKLVFHGVHANYLGYPLEGYAKNFVQLAKEAQGYGVTLCQENVYYCRLGNPDVVERVRPMYGEQAAFVLDLKQVVRQGSSIKRMMDAMGKDIRHIHISDYAPGKDCLAPGTGEFDFEWFIKALKKQQFQGDLIIELYRENFTNSQDLSRSMAYIQSLL